MFLRIKKYYIPLKTASFIFTPSPIEYKRQDPKNWYIASVAIICICLIFPECMYQHSIIISESDFVCKIQPLFEIEIKLIHLNDSVFIFLISDDSACRYMVINGEHPITSVDLRKLK
jgi:hypothetical protein